MSRTQNTISLLSASLPVVSVVVVVDVVVCGVRWDAP